MARKYVQFMDPSCCLATGMAGGVGIIFLACIRSLKKTVGTVTAHLNKMFGEVNVLIFSVPLTSHNGPRNLTKVPNLSSVSSAELHRAVWGNIEQHDSNFNVQSKDIDQFAYCLTGYFTPQGVKACGG